MPLFDATEELSPRVEVHLGIREDLWDFLPRVQTGVGVTVGKLGVELTAGARAPDAGETPGQLAGTAWTNGADTWALFRDDLGTLALLGTFVPFPDGIGPIVAVGPEASLTQYRLWTSATRDEHSTIPFVVDEHPFASPGLAARAGAQGRVGRWGLRATLTYRLTWLAEPDFEGGYAPVAAYGEWRSGFDLVVRL